MRITTLIADDEPHGRRAIRELLARASDFEVVEECGAGDHALASLRRGGIDVAFLDVRMPERTGLDVARALGDTAPLLVFVTAFDRHAVAAFDHFAVDYLLKPVDPQRFERTLERVRERLRQRAPRDVDLYERLAGRIAELTRRSAPIAVVTAGRTLFLDAEDFVWAQAEGNYVELHARNGDSWTLRTTLQQLEQQLQGCDVVRIHRAYLVGARHVRELRTADGGNTTTVRLRNGTDLPVGRTFRDDVVRRLGAG